MYVRSLGSVEDIANEVIEEFMLMLKSNGFLSYKLAKFQKNSTHMAPGENIDIVGKRQMEDGEIAEAQSEWETSEPPQSKIVIMMVDHYKASIMVPTRWEYRHG